MGCQEEEEGSKRRTRIGVRGGPIEGEREQGGKMTFTPYELDWNDPTASFPSCPRLGHTFNFSEVKKRHFFLSGFN